MAAMEKGEDSYQIIDGRCIGCGLCVSACSTEAISMVTKSGMEPPPKDFLQDTLQRIRTERNAIETKGKGSVS
jgi:Fe-S-cluster-containing hydrogenase component 2